MKICHKYLSLFEVKDLLLFSKRYNYNLISKDANVCLFIKVYKYV